MKAIVCPRYGVFDLAEIEKPVPDDDEVLIKVRAASVNPMDYYLLHGRPYVARLFTGFRKPKTSPGFDVAGEIESVGRNVKTLNAGDVVFGVARGAYAEYARTKEERVAIKPEGVSFEEAASAPIAGLTALQAVRDFGKVRVRQHVLINGAGGGVGTFAVQIAKSLGAEVTAVTTTKNLELVRTLGADRQIDYTRDDFTEAWQRYDVIIDCHATRPMSRLRRSLTKAGICVLVGAPADKIVSMLLGALTRKKVAIARASVKKRDLAALGEWIASHQVKPVIDSRFALTDMAKAMHHFHDAGVCGKVVITI